MQKENFVTVFDRAYMAKGLALLQSLEKHMTRPFRLFIYTIDLETYGLLNKILFNNKNAKIIYPLTFINEPLHTVTKSRAKPYQFFTYTPFIIEHAFINTGSDRVTYLDADTYFFANPDIAFEEMGSKSVGIVPHDFPPHDHNRLIKNGTFNVSFVCFTSKPESLQLLAKWRDQCLAKCDAESVGDQLYLDEWPSILGDKLHIFDSHKTGLGPWSAYTYKIAEEFGNAMVNEKRLVMYHNHELKKVGSGYFLTGYPTSENQQIFIYMPYINKLEVMEFSIIEAEIQTC